MNTDFQGLDHYLNDSDGQLSQTKDQEQLRTSSLMNDLNNIRQTQQSYGIPALGDLFRAKPDDIQDTINSIYYMLKQRVADIDFRQEARQKWGKLENEKQEVQDSNTRLKQRIEQLQSELKDTKLQLTNSETKLRQEKDKFQFKNLHKFNLEKDGLQKENQRLLSKQTHFMHEIKNRELQIEKLKESFKQKLFEKANRQQITGTMDVKEHAPIANPDLKFSRFGGDSDFHLMITQNQENIQKRLSDENAELKECLKQLQRDYQIIIIQFILDFRKTNAYISFVKELFDIVDLKTEIYIKRYKSEHSQQQNTNYDNEEVLRNEIERIREELFNLPFHIYFVLQRLQYQIMSQLYVQNTQQFQESGKEIISKFQTNFSKLRDFMEKIDKEVAQLSVFNEKNDVTYDDVTSKFSQITSVQQLKHLLKNYDALVEGQHQLLNQSITKMAKIPPPDEINSSFNRFAVLKDSEDFEMEKKQFEDMTGKMEYEKQKISEERERIEGEVRRIKEMNQQIQSSLFVSVK